MKIPAGVKENHLKWIFKLYPELPERPDLVI